jgi:hypothetical protein
MDAHRDLGQLEVVVVARVDHGRRDRLGAVVPDEPAARLALPAVPLVHLQAVRRAHRLPRAVHRVSGVGELEEGGRLRGVVRAELDELHERSLVERAARVEGFRGAR